MMLNIHDIPQSLMKNMFNFLLNKEINLSTVVPHNI